MERRVFLLGLDGASWNLLDRLFAAGVMPNLQRICREGTQATLDSTVPPITPVAWTTLMTGCNPGKHGIFSFTMSMKGNASQRLPVNRLAVQVPTIFDYMREGDRLISLNLPMSYPATPINGLMVTGMMTPLRRLERAQHPPDLLARLAKAGVDYTIDPRFELKKNVPSAKLMIGWQEAGTGFVRDLARITRNRMQAVQVLMAEEEWRVFICVVVGTDRLQHLYWDKLMQGEPGDIDPILTSYYAELDGHIAELTGRLQADDTLLIVSDHGFKGCRGSFYPNEWLRQTRWLSTAKPGLKPLIRIKKFLKRLGISRRNLPGVMTAPMMQPLLRAIGDIDLSRTKAYFNGSSGIRLNVRGREIQGLVEPDDYDRVQRQIMDELGQLRDAEGVPVINQVYRRQDIYHGPAAAYGPDIVFTFRDDRSYAAYTGEFGKGLFGAVPHITGDHLLAGVLVAWGGGIAGREERLHFQIQDVLPTLLHLCGRSVPGVCDGRVLAEILTPSDPVQVDQDWQRFLPEHQEFTDSADQQAEIKERLRALGYISDDD